jgi:type IV pilus assembly protein PilY1
VAGKSNRPLTHPSNGFTINNNTTLTEERLGLPSGDTAKRTQLINYIRGYDVYDDDQDGETADTLPWALGAFIHSRPAVISYDEDTTVIYAGANDGMLHAFWDGDPGLHPGGSELWAYIPPALLPKLQYLSGDGMVPAFYVDGSPKVYLKDANNDGRIRKTDGDQAILLCGLRRGGQYYFAIDVTDPENPEIPAGWADWGTYFGGDTKDDWLSTGMIGPDMTTSSDKKKVDATYPYSEMGLSFATPVIATINDGGTPAPVAFIGAGYDLNQDNGSPGSDTMGRGVYAVDVLTGSPVWTYTNAENSAMTHSITSSVAAIDTTVSGMVDRLYIGDTGGKLWRFDVGSSDPGTWTGKVIFKADPAGTAHRKFFYPPDVTEEDGYEMLFIGSGNRAHPLDDANVDYLYAIKDRNPALPLTKDDLVNMTDGKLMSGTEAEKNAIKATLESSDGWYIWLESTGEKALAPALVFGGVAYYTTFQPDMTAPIDPCESVASLGTARIYALDYTTGNAVFNFDEASAAIGKTDRFTVIGGSIPSGVVLLYPRRGSRGRRRSLLNLLAAGTRKLMKSLWSHFRV